MSGLLDAIGYVGGSLDKPGRAVRGLLSGDLGEGLAAIPFSDSLGLTDESNAVSGKQLVGTDNDLLGALVDTVTNPLSYLGAMGGAKFLEGARRIAPEAGSLARGSGLTHFTSLEAAPSIAREGAIRGRQGIFAMPDSAAKQSPIVRAARAGTGPSRMEVGVPIPEAANSAFEKVLPLGPYSAWKSLGGVRMSAPGEIDLATGAFNPSSSIWKSRAWMYGPDAAIYAGIPAGGLISDLTE